MDPVIRTFLNKGAAQSHVDLSDLGERLNSVLAWCRANVERSSEHEHEAYFLTDRPSNLIFHYYGTETNRFRIFKDLSKEKKEYHLSVVVVDGQIDFNSCEIEDVTTRNVLMPDAPIELEILLAAFAHDSEEERRQYAQGNIGKEILLSEAHFVHTSDRCLKLSEEEVSILTEQLVSELSDLMKA